MRIEYCCKLEIQLEWELNGISVKLTLTLLPKSLNGIAINGDDITKGVSIKYQD